MRLEIDASHAESTTSLFLIDPKHPQLRSVDYAKLALVALLALFCAAAPSFAQSNPTPSSSTAPATTPQSTKVTRDANGKPLVHTDTTVTVSADLTPEEKEGAEIEKHTAGYHGKEATPPCDQLIENYKTDLIPRAQQAKFPENRVKFLFEAYDAISKCQIQQKHYADAELSTRDALTQAEIWPGKDDSAYSGLWLRLASAQMGLEHWKDAEASASKSAELDQAQIDVRIPRLATASGDFADFVRDEIDRAHRDRAAALFTQAVFQMQQGNLDAAATSIDAAYKDAELGKLKGANRKELINLGANIADKRGNVIDIATWTARAVMTPSHDSPKN